MAGLFLGTPFHTFAPVCVHNAEHVQLVKEGGQSWKGQTSGALSGHCAKTYKS